MAMYLCNVRRIRCRMPRRGLAILAFITLPSSPFSGFSYAVPLRQCHIFFAHYHHFSSSSRLNNSLITPFLAVDFGDNLLHWRVGNGHVKDMTVLHNSSDNWLQRSA